jgi:hypothetical protein
MAIPWLLHSCSCLTQLVCTNYPCRRSIAIPPSGTPITVNCYTRFWADSHFCELETGESVGNMLIVLDDGDDRKDTKQILTALGLVSTKLT